MKVAIVSGSYPPEPCGVGAYVHRLAESLRSVGVGVELVLGSDWRIVGTSAIRQRIDSLQPDLVHVQYPTLGYGRSLAPQLLSVLRPGVVTLHEVRHTHPLRRLSLAPFVVSARHVVFTTEPEREYLVRFAPWIADRSSVIPVGNSISASPSSESRSQTEVLHFGLIRPNKGIEQVIELAGLLHKKRSSLQVRIVGDVAQKSLPYLHRLRTLSADAPVKWELGLSSDRVADVLARSRIGYLPFPDGASERRTSLMALLAAGVATITTRGEDTPAALSGAVEFAKSPAHALAIAEKLRADPIAVQRLATEGRRYAARSSWGRIAILHRSLYEDTLRA